MTVLGNKSLLQNNSQVTYIMLPALPSNPSVVPYQFTGFSGEMTFTQRLWNFYLKLSGVITMKVINWYCDSLIRRKFPGSPSVEEMMANISGLLINHNTAWEVPR